MLYFILEIIIWTAQFFPESEIKQQKCGKGIARANFHGESEVSSKSSTPQPKGYKTKTEQAPSGNHGPIGSVEASSYNDVWIEKTITDVPSQTNTEADLSDNASRSSTPKASIGHAMVDVSTQTRDAAVSEAHLRSTPGLETSSQIKGLFLANSDSAAEESIDEVDIEMETQTQEDSFAATSPGSNLGSEATLVNTPIKVLLPSLIQRGRGEDIQCKEDLQNGTPFSMETKALMNRAWNPVGSQRMEGSPTTTNVLGGCEQDDPGSRNFLSMVQNGGHGTPNDGTQSVLQDVDIGVPAVKAIPMVPEELLRTEEAAHQQTREELTKVEDWCKRLEDGKTWLRTLVVDVVREDAGLRTLIEDVVRENARIRRNFTIPKTNTQGSKQHFPLPKGV